MTQTLVGSMEYMQINLNTPTYGAELLNISFIEEHTSCLLMALNKSQYI